MQEQRFFITDEENNDVNLGVDNRLRKIKNIDDNKYLRGFTLPDSEVATFDFSRQYWQLTKNLVIIVIGDFGGMLSSCRARRRWIAGRYFH